MAGNDVHWDDLFPGRFLKAGNLHGGVTWTIASVQRETVGEDATVVLRFREDSRDMACNVTNGLALRTMFGDDPSKYVGKRVRLESRRVPAPGQRSGELVDAIRVVGSPDIAADITREWVRGSGSRVKKINLKLVRIT